MFTFLPMWNNITLSSVACLIHSLKLYAWHMKVLTSYLKRCWFQEFQSNQPLTCKTCNKLMKKDRMVWLKDFPLSYKATAELGFKPMMQWLVIEDCTYKLQHIAWSVIRQKGDNTEGIKYYRRNQRMLSLEELEKGDFVCFVIQYNVKWILFCSKNDEKT
jgi:hypothetical protein